MLRKSVHRSSIVIAFQMGEVSVWQVLHHVRHIAAVVRTE
jgi:hypothetical protein